jgi:hypothetical protein
MDGYIWGLGVGVSAAVVLVAILKWRRTRDKRMSVTERADYLSKRRARMLPALAVIFLSQQGIYLSNSPDSAAQTAKISAWLVLSVILIAALATKGFWLAPKEVRDLIDDENTQANRSDAMRWGFLFSMAAAIGLYFFSMFDNLKGRESVHIIMSLGIAAALIRWGFLERRAHRDA